MDRLGLGYDEFKKSHRKLVYASINGVGAYGPYANRRVYDAVIQAISGFAALKGDSAPEMVNSLVCDKITSLTAAEAIVAAISGRAQWQWPKSRYLDARRSCPSSGPTQ